MRVADSFGQTYIEKVTFVLRGLHSFVAEEYDVNYQLFQKSRK